MWRAGIRLLAASADKATDRDAPFVDHPAERGTLLSLSAANRS
jgi:hypothetical protein